MGIRWLTKEHKLRKMVSLLVIYMKSAAKIGRIRIGRKLLQPTKYDWYRSGT